VQSPSVPQWPPAPDRDSRPGLARGDFTDLLTLAQNYNEAAPEPATGYAFGDFDFSGVVDFNDLLLVAQNYGGEPTLTSFDAKFRHDFEFALASVPEPSMLGLVGLGMGLMGRRR